eukprot:8618572-Karenia_brevis.AAC.1
MADDTFRGIVPAGKRIGHLTDVTLSVLDQPDAEGNARHALVGKIRGVDVWKYKFPGESYDNDA